jgi:hypothetical protein
MATFAKIVQRYNPHKIQKQAKKWPVFTSCSSLTEDIILLQQEIWNKSKDNWSDQFNNKLKVEEELLQEFGQDACRLAILNKQFAESPLIFLESSFKWLGKFWQLFNSDQIKKFNPVIWLETALKIKDRFALKKDSYGSFAEVKKAFKISPPNINLATNEKRLVLSCLFPFAPLLSRFLMEKNNLWPILPENELLQSFTKYKCIRYSIGNSGWIWGVFPAKEFSQDPVQAFLNYSRLKNLKGSFKFKLNLLKEGYKICLEN